MPRTTPFALRIVPLLALALVGACDLLGGDEAGEKKSETSGSEGATGGGASGSGAAGSGGSTGSGGAPGVGGWWNGGGCGDATCESADGETCESCPEDCGACSSCGNAACDEGETCESCPGDCGACPMCGGAGPGTTGLDAEEQSFLQILNQYRAQSGLGPLAACTSLSRAAQGHSEDMRDQDYFSHDGLNGSSPWARSCDACYELACSDPLGTVMGENIAAGNAGAQATFEQWQGSPGHNANMLGSSFTVIGIGRATGGGTYGAYWTTVFGGDAEASCQ